MFLVMGASGTGIWQMLKIGSEIEGIAEEDMPVTEAITKITIHQLEQAILFERGLAIANGLTTEPQNINPDDIDPARMAHFKEVEHEFMAQGQSVEAEMLDVEEIVRHAIETAHSEEARIEFENILIGLEKIEGEHTEYEKITEELFHSVEKGELEHAAEISEEAEHQGDNIDHELESLLTEIEHFTAEALLTAEEHEHHAQNLLIGVAVGSLIMGCLLSFLIVQSIVSPIKDMTSAMGELTGGNLDIEIPNTEKTDEIGTMAQAVLVFKENAVQIKQNAEAEVIRERTAAEDKATQEREAEEQTRATMNKLADNFEGTVSASITSIVDGSKDILAAASTMSRSMDSSAGGTMEVAEASISTAQGAVDVAVAASELSASTTEISRQVAESSRVSNAAVREAGEVNDKIQGLNEAAQKIGQVVQLITDIAEQTNLLVLNATIEAARAGDAGKGFAVVASEVKNLANQTAKATEEISNQIITVQEETRSSAEAIGNISKTIYSIDEVSTSISAAVEEQGAATSEIASTVERLSENAKIVADKVAGVTRASAQSYSSAILVTWAGNDLSKPVNDMQEGVEDFLNNVRQ